MTMPVFVAKGQDDTLTGNEANIAYQIMTSDRPNGKGLTTFHEFKTSLGAGMHCSIGAEDQLQQVTLDWLAGVWGEKSVLVHTPLFFCFSHFSSNVAG